MTYRSRWALRFVVLLIAAWSAAAAQVTDGRGRDVTVALFSTQTLRAVMVTPLDSHGWTARCAQCPHRPLTTPMQITGPMEIFAGGTLRVTDNATGEGRTASGLWHLRAPGHNGEIDVVLTLPSESYVAAVLNAEAAPDEPAQSLRALAILARTYALNGSHFKVQPGHLPAELCDSTQCQALLLAPVSRNIDDATRATAGETLWFHNHRAEAFFSQSCGGSTEDADAVWPALGDLPYLRSHPDPYCVRRDRAMWHAEVPLTRFAEIAQTEGWHLPPHIVAAHIVQRSVSHRALRIAFTDANRAESTVSASALRFAIGRALGWNQVRSDAFEIGVRNGSLIFDGRGHGHGVGLCQMGASEMSAEGKSNREILAFYFPGTAVRVTPMDDGWREMRTAELTVRTAQASSPTQNTTLQQTWSEAQKRFPPRRAVTPEIIFAPTTEIFRQLTSQPGWTLATTRGSTITLRPESVLQAHGRSVSSTLLHEMLHVLVEAEAGDHAPLWLREGLVEVLAGEAAGRAPTASRETMPVAAIDSALLQTNSLLASQRAHRAAAARVHALLTRYGLSTVRGWLVSGVPAGVE